MCIWFGRSKTTWIWNKEGYIADPEKVQAIKEMSPPNNVKDFRIFRDMFIFSRMLTLIYRNIDSGQIHMYVLPDRLGALSTGLTLHGLRGQNLPQQPRCVYSHSVAPVQMTL